MSKRILVSLSIIGVVAVIAIGATTAYFSDTETSQDNTFSAGTLDLQVVFPYEGEPYPGFPPTKTYNGENIPGVEIRDIKPGDSGFLRYHVNNIGTIGGELYITLANVSNSPGVTPEPEPLPDNGELGENLLINIWYGDESEYPNYSKHIVKDKKLNDLSNVRYLLGDLTAEGDPTTTDGKDVYIKWELPSSVGNEVQGDVVSFDVDLDLMQKGGTFDDLMGWWKFDEGTGDIAYDSSGYGNDGTIHGATWADGKFGKALSFDGDDYVDVPDDDSLKPELVTLEAWVKSDGSPGRYKYIAGKKYAPGWGSYHLYTGNTGGLRFYIGHSGGFIASPDAGTGIWDDNWHHIVGTYNGYVVKLYVDGNEISGGTETTEDIAYNSENFYIGSYGTGYYFKGLIDEVKVYNRPLSGTEILEHYQAGP